MFSVSIKAVDQVGNQQVLALLLKIEKCICNVVEREQKWNGSKQYYNVDSGDMFLYL